MAIAVDDKRHVDWLALSEKIRRYLKRSVGLSLSDADIDELSQECLVRLLDPKTEPWRPDEAPLIVFARGVAWGASAQSAPA